MMRTRRKRVWQWRPGVAALSVLFAMRVCAAYGGLA